MKTIIITSALSALSQIAVIAAFELPEYLRDRELQKFEKETFPKKES